MATILDRRLVVVTGKGGVGKTTVAAALGLLGARSGRRTVVCEVARQERISQAFGKPPAGPHEIAVAPGLNAFSINPDHAKDEWLRHQLRSSALAGVVGHSRIFQYLTAAAPGLTEVLTIGKVWELAQLQRRSPGAAPYDLTIVDAPATGGGLAMLSAPRTYAAIAKVGPVGTQATMVDSFLRDAAQTAVVAVTLPEEMPVAETIDLERRLHDELGMALERVFVNGVLPERLSAREADAIHALDGAGSPAAREALAAALAARMRSQGQRSQLARLRRAVETPVKTLPFLITPELQQADLETLADELARKL